jgi:triacylglycerol lipase
MITRKEVDFEKYKYLLNNARAENAICRTKYPILLIHGVFFRDSSLFNYWGRIPLHLKKNGAEIFYGEHESAASAEESGIELAQKITQIVNKTGCEKVNIIAHSKGGLDCRYAVSCTEAGKYVASLTTVNTPHCGCLFADYLLGKISPKIQNSVAKKYNTSAKLLGDKNPDFIKAVKSLTNESCADFNTRVPDSDTVFYQSIATKMNMATSGKFPLNMLYPFVKHFGGENDGLVAVESMKWGNTFRLVTVPKGRGISHGDIIDLNRENIPGFDVREFYTDVVHDLKMRGF